MNNYLVVTIITDIFNCIIFIVKFSKVILSGFIEECVYKLFGNRTTNLREEQDIHGKVVIVTGASRGIGKAAAFEFAERGATVILGCVDIIEGKHTEYEINQRTGNDNVIMMHLDLSEMLSVERFALVISRMYPEVKILVNNAGVGSPKSASQKLTKDKFNLQMSVNHMGHFLLTNLLLENLRRGSPSRIVTISSLLQLNSKLDTEDLMMEKSGFGAFNHLPYCNSKFANALFNKELGRRLQGTGITCYALCPSIVNTGIFDDIIPLGKLFFKTALIFIGFSPEQAASEFVLHCALNTNLSKESGLMYRFRKPFQEANRKLTDDLALNLWDQSAKATMLQKRIFKFRKSNML